MGKRCIKRKRPPIINVLKSEPRSYRRRFEKLNVKTKDNYINYRQEIADTMIST